MAENLASHRQPVEIEQGHCVGVEAVSGPELRYPQCLALEP